MSLDYGVKPDIPAGMTMAIYTEMDNQLATLLKDAIDNALSDEEKDAAEDALKDARESWKKLSFAIAKGVVDHITTHMEIYNIHTQGNINTTVSGNSAAALSGSLNHDHSIHLAGEQPNVEFIQNDDGTGHVR